MSQAFEPVRSDGTAWVVGLIIALAGAIGFGVLIVEDENFGIGLVGLAIMAGLLLSAQAKASRLAATAVLCAMIVVTDLAILSTTAEDTIAFDPQVLLKGVVYGAAVLLLILKPPRFKVTPWIAIVFLYPLMASISASYSELPMYSLAASLVLWIQLLLAIFVVRHAAGEWLSSMWRAVAYAISVKLVLSWLLVFVVPNLVILKNLFPRAPISSWGFNRFGGVAGTNILGLNAAVLALIALISGLHSQSRKQRLVDFMMAFLALVTLVATQSRTAIVALLAGFLGSALFVTQKKWYRATATALLLLIGYVIASSPESVVNLATRGVEDIDRLRSLEGRTQIWHVVISRIQASPLFGHGFGSGRVLLGPVYMGGTTRTVYSAHNMFLEVMLSLGIFGAVLFVATLAITGVTLIRRLNGEYGRHKAPYLAAWATFIVLCVNGLAESGMGGVLVVQTVLLFLCLATGLLADRQGEA